MTKLKVGVIGVGGIAQDRHIPALLKLKDTVSLVAVQDICLLYTSPSPRDVEESRMPSSA